MILRYTFVPDKILTIKSKIMKKLIVLSAVFATLTLASCNKKTETETEVTTTDTVVTPETTTVEADTATVETTVTTETEVDTVKK